VTLPPHGLLATGLYWSGGSCMLTLTDPTGIETSTPLGPGTDIAWKIRGPRRCIGIWRPDSPRRRMCPLGSRIPDAGSQAQCPACAGGDPGRALARDGALDDPRPFALYLACFGPTLLKIGLTALERGSDRLAEQGALAYTWLGHGPLLSVRRAENTATAAGIVRDRISRRAKTTAWWQLQDPPQRHAQLAAAHHQLTSTLTWPDGLTPAPFEVHDLSATYGLTRHPHPDTQEITAVGEGAVLAATLASIAGRDGLLHLGDVDPGAASGDTGIGGLAGQQVLMNLRLLSGWVLMPCAVGARTTGPLVSSSGPGRLAGGDRGVPTDDVLF